LKAGANSSWRVPAVPQPVTNEVKCVSNPFVDGRGGGAGHRVRASSYNGLVALRNRYKNAFAQIDVQLKRRYDLIPNLVETAKGYLKHERETLENVIAARNAASSANVRAAQAPGDMAAMKNLSGAEAALTGSLSRLFAVAVRISPQ
jgi:hypothetical protein